MTNYSYVISASEFLRVKSTVHNRALQMGLHPSECGMTLDTTQYDIASRDNPFGKALANVMLSLNDDNRSYTVTIEQDSDDPIVSEYVAELREMLER